MRRAAASTSNGALLPSSPLPPNSPQDLTGHSAKRQKLSYSLPQSSDPGTLTPHSSYHSEDPSTPLLRNESSRQPSYSANDAETPWVLNTSSSVEPQRTPSPPQYASPLDVIVGRRTFGNFKKITMEKAAAKMVRQEDESPSSEDSNDDYKKYKARMHGSTPQSCEKPKGKRRQNQDNDKMDNINLKKLRSGGDIRSIRHARTWI